MIANQLLFFGMWSCVWPRISEPCGSLPSRSLSTLSNYICCGAGYVVAFRAIVIVVAVVIPVLYIC